MYAFKYNCPIIDVINNKSRYDLDWTKWLWNGGNRKAIKYIPSDIFKGNLFVLPYQIRKDSQVAVFLYIFMFIGYHLEQILYF